MEQLLGEIKSMLEAQGKKLDAIEKKFNAKRVYRVKTLSIEETNKALEGIKFPPKPLP
jgi:hypothetical protein